MSFRRDVNWRRGSRVEHTCTRVCVCVCVYVCISHRKEVGGWVGVRVQN